MCRTVGYAAKPIEAALIQGYTAPEHLARMRNWARMW